MSSVPEWFLSFLCTALFIFSAQLITEFYMCVFSALHALQPVFFCYLVHLFICNEKINQLDHTNRRETPCDQFGSDTLHGEWIETDWTELKNNLKALEDKHETSLNWTWVSGITMIIKYLTVKFSLTRYILKIQYNAVRILDIRAKVCRPFITPIYAFYRSHSIFNLPLALQ